MSRAFPDGTRLLKLDGTDDIGVYTYHPELDYCHWVTFINPSTARRSSGIIGPGIYGYTKTDNANEDFLQRFSYRVISLGTGINTLGNFPKKSKEEV